MNLENLYILEDRGILYINGNDVSEFLQNLISNDINKVTVENTCFASLLTPQGKYLFDFIIIKHKSGFLIDCEKSQIDRLYTTLNTYKLRSNIEIINLSNEFTVAAISQEKFMTFEKAQNLPGNTINYNEDCIFLDPRNVKLGGRIIMNLEKLELSIKKLNLKKSSPEEYYRHSYEMGIPQINMNNLNNKIFGIECNFQELNGIDFKKGCYVGQENTARIKLKNKLSKRLLPIKLINGKISEDEKIYNNNVEIGKILINDEYPFALIKFLDKNFNKNNIYKGENGSYKILIPKWLEAKI